MAVSKHRSKHKAKTALRGQRISEFKRSVDNMYKQAGKNQLKLQQAQNDVNIGLHEVIEEYSPEQMEIQVPEHDPLGLLKTIDEITGAINEQKTEEE